MRKIVYIMSDNRSGSTLLDQLLGAHGEVISLGEIHHLPAYALQDRALYDPIHPLDCSCGTSVAECPFWTSVETKLGHQFATLKLKLRFFDRTRSPLGEGQQLGRMAARFVRRHPRYFSRPFSSMIFDAKTMAGDSFRLFDAILDTTGANLLIDSSKDPFRFRALYEQKPERMLGIMLGRDYRGTVHSKMKRGRELEKSAKDWALRMTQMKVLTRDLSPRQLIKVRYEDLCQHPRSELAKVCDFAGVDFSEALLTRPATGVHHLGGSPSKFDPARKTIELDQSYLHAFTESELATMRALVRDVALEWGYV